MRLLRSIMFENLTEKFNRTFKRLRGQGKLSEKNIKEALREVRFALLEADVNYKVAKQFVADLSERAVGREVMESLCAHSVSLFGKLPLLADITLLNSTRMRKAVKNKRQNTIWLLEDDRRWRREFAPID